MKRSHSDELRLFSAITCHRSSRDPEILKSPFQGKILVRRRSPPAPCSKQTVLKSVSVRGLIPPHCVEMSRTTDPVSHWEDLEAWLSAMTGSLLPKAAETLRHQTQDQLDDNLTSIMKHDPCQSYNHKELAKISGSLSHTLIATLKLSDRHVQKELTRAQRRIKQLELEVQERQEASDEMDSSTKEEIARLQETLTTTTQEREQVQSAYAELTSKLHYAEQLLEKLKLKLKPLRLT
ncbi:hypothetical protein QQF64_004521 [Cirrhinus molitorella]|uniref:Uncharacterized protein n=1 Tax=Cirrhinus molitorella TaxID=172907 RepID=A0ABR3MIL4_9TELE